jgi:hypothetical protein
MARATKCRFDNKEITVEDAIQIRDATPVKLRKTLKFRCRCIECGNSVRPHRSGGNAEAHFEHFKRNPDCTLSDPAR